MIRKKQKINVWENEARKWKEENQGNKRLKKMKGLRGKEWGWEKEVEREGRDGWREISAYDILSIWY